MSRTDSNAFFTQERIARLLLAVFTMMLMVAMPAQAGPTDGYSGPHFGDGNIPAGCEEDLDPSSPRWWSQGGGGLTAPAWTDSTAICHHQRTGQNRLDSSQIDVLILVPATEPERTLRLARQSIEMWEGGLTMLADQMGLDWMAEGLDFHITVDAIDVTGDGGGEFTTYPIWDPEIIVVTGVNPVGTLGIGTTPVGLGCHGIENPFDMEAWENLPGFDSHHDGRTGTYVEDCGGAGGDICFAVNTTIDTSVYAWDSMFDLVSHELGHCLSVGHVGDGAEGGWGGLPPDDIMAYSEGGDGTKCVSTLNVESFALRMSRHLDTNGDGVVDSADVLVANNATGGGYKGDGAPFQVMHPDDYAFASATGKAIDCPQPDSGLVPGPRTDWTPEPVLTSAATLTVTGPADGTENQSGEFLVTGSVEHVSLEQEETDPTETAGSVQDASGDATSEYTDLLGFSVDVTDTHVNATLDVAALWPVANSVSGTSYSLVVDGRSFDSFFYSIGGTTPRTWDSGASVYPTADQAKSTWDVEAGTVTFTISRAYLANTSTTAPYEFVATANVGGVGPNEVDDRAPDAGKGLGLNGPENVAVWTPLGHASAATVSFEHDGTYGNTFFTEQSSFGVTPIADDFVFGEPVLAATHYFQLPLEATSDVEFHLEWSDDLLAQTDLDLYVTGNGVDSGSEGASATDGAEDLFEVVALEDVQGTLTIAVEPYFVADPIAGTTYTLTATVTTAAVDTDGDGIFDDTDKCPAAQGPAPHGCPDTDGDGVHDGKDTCPATFGEGVDGCPVLPTEFVEVLVGPVLVGSQAVDTTAGPDTFAINLTDLEEGSHTLTIRWVDGGKVLASTTRTVVHDDDDDDDGVANVDDACPGFDDTIDVDGDGIPDDCDDDVQVGTDTDGDGVADDVDNCPEHANADQANLDGDRKGDVCDNDIDGDGHANGKERAHGTDERDATSYPSRGTPNPNG